MGIGGPGVEQVNAQCHNQKGLYYEPLSMTNLVTVFDAHSIPSTASIEALSPLVITVLST